MQPAVQFGLTNTVWCTVYHFKSGVKQDGSLSLFAFNCDFYSVYDTFFFVVPSHHPHFVDTVTYENKVIYFHIDLYIRIYLYYFTYTIVLLYNTCFCYNTLFTYKIVRSQLALYTGCSLGMTNTCKICISGCSVDSDKPRLCVHYYKAVTYVWQQMSQSNETRCSQIICG